MAKKSAQIEQTEIPMEGPGVAALKDKKLDKLCDEFIELRDSKAELAEKLGEVELKILDRMAELGIQSHRFADQLVKIKLGSPHIKIKTVQADGEEAGAGDSSKNGEGSQD